MRTGKSKPASLCNIFSRYLVVLLSLLADMEAFAGRAEENFNGQFGQKSPSGIPLFDHSKEPSHEDWRYFLKLTDEAQEKIWISFSQKKVQLKDWSWAWRIGWIKACTSNQRSFCDTVLKEAMKDRALVVRAEAVTALGRIYEKSQRSDIIARIALLGSDSRNMRNKQPMYIQQRVIFSLRNIGGDEAKKAAWKIAASDESLKAYFHKVFQK